MTIESIKKYLSMNGYRRDMRCKKAVTYKKTVGDIIYRIQFSDTILSFDWFFINQNRNVWKNIQILRYDDVTDAILNVILCTRITDDDVTDIETEEYLDRLGI